MLGVVPLHSRQKRARCLHDTAHLGPRDGAAPASQRPLARAGGQRHRRCPRLRRDQRQPGGTRHAGFRVQSDARARARARGERSDHVGELEGPRREAGRPRHQDRVDGRHRFRAWAVRIRRRRYGRSCADVLERGSSAFHHRRRQRTPATGPDGGVAVRQYRPYLPAREDRLYSTAKTPVVRQGNGRCSRHLHRCA